MLSLKASWHKHQQTETDKCHQHSATFHTHPYLPDGFRQGNKFCSLGGRAHLLAGWLTGPKVELDWPGVSRTALGVAQPRTGRHAYLNCRRRLDKTNPDSSPVSRGASIARRTWSRCARVHYCGGRLDTN